ncbi:starch-binding domain-containing protein 1 [Eublepharis macularius]|uniref:Starch-binding domain-containing protein 1 n=1 Tax=Eublepharis macularius TaxID=481883 RepID=A0AA97JWB6_EUBMA|nr:starch-binding domain-containing protein 1 [Eublepharis macularius]
MAQGGEGGEAALPAGGDDDAGPLAGLWSAFFAALVAALLAWLWYGGKGGGKEEEAAAAAPEGSPQPRRAEAEEPLQGSHKGLAPETEPNDVSVCREPAWNPLASPGDHSNPPSIPKETAESDPVVKEPVTSLMNCKEYPRNEIFSFPATSEPPQKEGEEKYEERCTEQLLHSSVDHEEWEIVAEQSAGDEATRNNGMEDAGSSKDLEQARRVAAVPPMPQTVHMTFRVHYITYSDTQLIAVTGDHECLGQWHHYVPLRCDKDGFWSDSVILPVDTRVEWKFIVVENGKVRRWEECDNRTLTTEHEDWLVHKWWGYH